MDSGRASRKVCRKDQGIQYVALLLIECTTSRVTASPTITGTSTVASENVVWKERKRMIVGAGHFVKLEPWYSPSGMDNGHQEHSISPWATKNPHAQEPIVSSLTTLSGRPWLVRFEIRAQQAAFATMLAMIRETTCQICIREDGLGIER